jgi:hypothetical protein
VLPARFLLYTVLRQDVALNVSAACGFYAGTVMQSFEGAFTRDDARLYMAPYLTGAIAENFSGTIS